MLAENKERRERKRKMMVIEIVKKYLKENGFDGLVGDDCGCGIEDLAPCGCDSIASCSAAIKVKQHCEDCDAGCDAAGEAEFCYQEAALKASASTVGQQPAGQNVNESLDNGAVATSPDPASA
jgi:hypothetical protein